MGSSRFMDGLMWGMIIGGAAVFLFGTQKGKRFLDILAQEGADGFGKVLKEIEEEIEDTKEEAEGENMGEKETAKDIITQKLEKSSMSANSHKPKSKRFFSSSKKPL